MRANIFNMLFFMMVILSLFSFNTSNCMKRAAVQDLKSDVKRQKADDKEAALQYDEKRFAFIQAYISSRPTEIKDDLIKAVKLVKCKKIYAALAIFNNLISKYQEPIAYFFMGKLFEDLGDDDFIEPYLAAYKYYNLAFEHHFAQALPELMALGQVFAEFIGKSQEPAHS